MVETAYELVKGDHVNNVGILDGYLRSIPAVSTFSTANSVRDRMLFNKYPRYSLINRIVKAYKQYYESHLGLDNEDLKMIQMLLIEDINLLIKSVQSRIIKGSTLQSLFALNQFNEEISKKGVELSRVYRDVLISEKILGFIPKQKYVKWKSLLSEFYDTLCMYCFGVPYNNELTVIDKI
jgi:hypothetical protein